MQDGLTYEVLKQTLNEVQRDEAEAIALLVSLLDLVRQTSNTALLEPICQVVMQWQHRPPRGIVTDLMKVTEDMECQARGRK